jgi:hypothetical protein
MKFIIEKSLHNVGRLSEKDKSWKSVIIKTSSALKPHM